MKLSLVLFSMLITLSSYGQSLFVMKKNLNPGNVLHFEAQTKGCKLISESIKAFWVMGESSGQIENLNNKEKKYFLPEMTYQKNNEVDFTLGALQMMGQALPSKTIKVRLKNCKPQAFMELKGQEIEVSEIYVEGRFTLTLTWQTRYMVFKGTTADGSKFSYKLMPNR
jgi:hypothetical protein